MPADLDGSKRPDPTAEEYYYGRMIGLTENGKRTNRYRHSSVSQFLSIKTVKIIERNHPWKQENAPEV
jgi:hypothetical protein